MAYKHHGMLAKYEQGCRCALCEIAVKLATPAPVARSVPTGIVRVHLKALADAGWTLSAIADRSGYSHQLIRNIVNGRAMFIDSLIAEDLLSMPVTEQVAA